jgi:hypothetical protein
MTYVSPFWAIEREVIPEVANFEEEGLFTPEGWERKHFFENLLVHVGFMKKRHPVFTLAISKHILEILLLCNRLAENPFCQSGQTD